jgi:hypothetical protein
MILTPSNGGNLVAGVGVGTFAWAAFLKSDHIPWISRLMTTKRKESSLTWINDNKGMSLLGMEAVNFGIHGITDPNSVMFALGNTILNIIMLWVFLPVRQLRAGRRHVQEVLRIQT